MRLPAAKTASTLTNSTCETDTWSVIGVTALLLTRHWQDSSRRSVSVAPRDIEPDVVSRFVAFAVAAGATMTIDAGARLKLQSLLTVNGSLQAQGTSSAPVVFGPYSSRWLGFVIRPGSTVVLDHAVVDLVGVGEIPEPAGAVKPFSAHRPRRGHHRHGDGQRDVVWGNLGLPEGGIGGALLDGTFPYDELPTCSDDIQNGNELGVDCGGPCPVCASCDDGVQNGSETAVDCGGSCPACPSCTDGLQNGDEDGVDCGGSCMECPSCDDGEQNGDETDTDCGGSCSPCASCSDGLQNGTETGVDCGGSCLDCPSCFDGLQNGDESAVDCGGSCQPCASCSDGLQNGNETGIDCGGACATCSDLCDDQVTYDARSMTHTQTMNVCSRALRPHAQILVQRAEPSMTAAAGASTAAPARGAPATASMPARALQPLSPTPADCNHLRIGSNHPRVWVETSVAMSHEPCRRWRN